MAGEVDSNKGSNSVPVIFMREDALGSPEGYADHRELCDKIVECLSGMGYDEEQINRFIVVGFDANNPDSANFRAKTVEDEEAMPSLPTPLGELRQDLRFPSMDDTALDAAWVDSDDEETESEATVAICRADAFQLSPSGLTYVLNDSEDVFSAAVLIVNLRSADAKVETLLDALTTDSEE